MRILLAVLMALTFAASSASSKEDIQIGLSDEAVAITSNFDGTNVVVFGSIENGEPDDLTNAQYDVVVVVVGPEEDVVVRRKNKHFGIWVNGVAVPFARVPSFYSLASNRPLERVASVETLRELQLGFSNLSLEPNEEAVKSGVASEEEYRTSLNRLKASGSLSLKDDAGVKFLSPTLFRARLAVPANVPIGRHTARAYLFKNGNMIVKKSARLAVRKKGFEQYTYDLAHKYGLYYGIIAVLIAIATGWLASVVFRKD